MKQGILSSVLSSHRVEIKQSNDSTSSLEVDLLTNITIPVFSKFQTAGNQLGGFEVKQYLQSFVGSQIQYSIEKDSLNKAKIFLSEKEGNQDEASQISLNDQLEEFIKSGKFDESYTLKANNYVENSCSNIPLIVGKTYDIYFEDLTLDGQFIAYEKSTQSLFVFEPLFLSIPVIGLKYKINLEQNLIRQKVLRSLHQIQVAQVSICPHNNNVFIVHGKLKESVELLKNGIAQLIDAAYLMIDDQDELEKFDEAVNSAKEENVGMWAHQTDFESLANRIDSFLGQVVEVEQGDILIIEKLSEEGKLEPNYIKIQLSKVYCPQGLEKGAFESKDFTRKLTIGQEVDVFLEKEIGALPSATVILSQTHLNLNLHLIQNGYARIKENVRGKLLESKWIEAENQEKEAALAQKGIHNKDLGIVRFKEIGVKETVDLYQTQIENQHKKEGYQCIVEKIVSGDRLLLRFNNFGNNPNEVFIQEQYKRSFSLNYKTLMNRNVTVDVMGVHDGCLVVKLFDSNKQDQSILLLEKGLAYFKQETDTYDSAYEVVQKKAKDQKLGVWAKQETSSILQLQDNSSSMLKLIKKGSSFGGGQTPVHISQVRDAGEFYVIFEDNPNQSKIDSLVDNFDKSKLQKLPSTKINSLCLALSVQDSKYYRGKIIGKSKKTTVEVEFIDYGITEDLPFANLSSLPIELAVFEAQCQLCSLAYVKVPGQNHRLSKVAKQAFEKLIDKGYVDAEFVGSEFNRTSIILYYEGDSELDLSINSLLIKQGLARINHRVVNNPFSDERFQDLENDANNKQIGIWSYDNEDRLSDSDGSDFDDY